MCAKMTAEFDSIIVKLGDGGANENAAKAIVDELG